jgi:ribonuclease HI
MSTNPFLTAWDPPLRGPRANTLPNEIKSLLKTAKKFNVSFAPIKISKQIKKQLPTWHHIGAPTTAFHKTKDKCLQNTHKSHTIKNMIKISKHTTNIQNNSQRHLPHKDCTCPPCQKDQQVGCSNPHKCATTAREILSKITPKYDTGTKPKKDELSLTHRRKEKNTQAHQSRNGEILFDPTTIRTNLKDCFRIFTDPKYNSIALAHRLQNPTHGLNLINKKMTIFTDGSCTNNRKENAKSGCDIWIEEGHQHNTALRIPGNNQSNQCVETLAILVALQKIEPYIPITFMTDSKYTINSLTKHLPTWEDTGWIGIMNSTHLKATAYHLRKHLAQTGFILVKGHSGLHGNEQADHLAKEGTNKLTEDSIDLTIPNEFNLQGAKLATMTQAQAYKGIREQKKKSER